MVKLRDEIPGVRSGHRVCKSLALGCVPAALAEAQSGIEVEILELRRPATIACKPVYDPDGARMRS
jgi:dimethylglycine dehydrogenase